MELELALVLLAMALAGCGAYLLTRRKVAATAISSPDSDNNTEEGISYQVSYVPPEFEWSGTATGTLPIKVLTYKQYECLEDARYGFKIVGLPPTERMMPQPHKTRAHGLRTVASLVKHGFLNEDGNCAYVITDRGLNALEVCSVRY